jgi:protein-S-isoprenylcysteine O-methyltransferase Ste14
VAPLAPLVRHALAVILLPFTVTVVVPVWLARRFGVAPSWPASAEGWLLALLGLAALLLGAILLGACLRRFGREGRGTLAPWDPPTHLVVRGPYAYVRHPMISGVVLLLIAESLLLRSAAHLAWAVGFALVNAAYLPLVEEPGLRRRFGAAYDEYAKNVPRLIPRTTPWGVTPSR